MRELTKDEVAGGFVSGSGSGSGSGQDVQKMPTMYVTPTQGQVDMATGSQMPSNGGWLIETVSGATGVAVTGACTASTGGTAAVGCALLGVAAAATAKQEILTPRDYPVRVTGTMP